MFSGVFPVVSYAEIYMLPIFIATYAIGVHYLFNCNFSVTDFSSYLYILYDIFVLEILFEYIH